MLEIRSLTKKTKDASLLQDIELSADVGILGIVGPRGAGKSTLLNIIAGLVRPTEGNVLINGADLYKMKATEKRTISYLLEGAPVYSDMTPYEFLVFVGEAKKIPYEKLYRQIEEVLELTELAELRDESVSKLSKSRRRILGIAQTLLGNPSVVIFDEPFEGMNEQDVEKAKEIFSILKKIKTVIISSSKPQSVLHLCDNIAILTSGRVLASGSVEKIQKMFSSINALELSIKKTDSLPHEALSTVSGFSQIVATRSTNKDVLKFKLAYDGREETVENIKSVLSDADISVISLENSSLTLDDLCFSPECDKEVTK